MVEVRDLTVQYRRPEGDFCAVRDAAFRLERGSVTALIGPNGCGKSTVLRAVAGQIKPKSGIVLLDGRDRSGMSSREAARKMAFLPQHTLAPADATVEAVVEYGRTPFLRFGRGLSRKDREKVRWALSALKLDGMERRAVSALSGGEQQRVWIAMCLAQEPQLLLLDEPTTYLDIAGQYSTLRLVERLNRELGLTILMVLHDLNQAARFSHRILAMRQGRILGEGTVREMITAPMVEELFGAKGIVMDDPVTGTPMFIPGK